jgi:membrane protein
LTNCRADQITITAGHLAYVTLLSLVPFVAVTFTLMSAFPAFQGVREQIENFIYSNFLPASGEVVQQYIGEFVANASQMTAISLVFLVLVALLLIANIDKTLNRIWKTHNQRRGIISFSIYWMVLTLGPILIGLSLITSSYLITLEVFDNEYTRGVKTLLLSLAPFFTSVTAFIIVYMVVPNKVVKFKHAAIGGVIAAGLFELSKAGFAAYVTHFPSYQAIYGAMAALPILFVWVYLSWMVVLIGAECVVVAESQQTTNEETNDDFDVATTGS